MKEMYEGEIDNLIVERGFGFIKASDGKNVFFHARDLRYIRFEQLRIGDKMEWEEMDTKELYDDEGNVKGEGYSARKVYLKR